MIALPLPTKETLTFRWVAFLVVGAIIGYELREVVFAADPSNSLVGLDWGIMIGAIVYYGFKIIGNLS
jgi:xanthosine utilization system XapX-like protein